MRLFIVCSPRGAGPPGPDEHLIASDVSRASPNSGIFGPGPETAGFRAYRAAVPEITVRPFRASDDIAVARLTVDAYRQGGSALSEEYWTFLRDVKGRQAASSGILVAERHGVPIGAVMLLRPGDDEWEDRPVPSGDSAFRALAVAPEARGLGVGTQLVHACLAWASSIGSTRLVITSLDWMAAAHRLYARQGFMRRPDLDVLFPDGPGRVFTRDLVDGASRRFRPPGPVPDPLPFWTDVWELPPAYVQRQAQVPG